MRDFVRFLREEDGQGISEYAVILGIIVLAAIGLAIAFRTQLRDWWETITTGLGQGASESTIN